MGNHMKAIPLITSLPPVFSRLADDGTEIGMDWLTCCVTSWLNEGFHPITVNSDKEKMLEFSLLSEFDQRKTSKDGFEEFGKRYVSLGEMMNCALENVDGPVAIINSDITLRLSDAAKERISNLQPGTCIISNRIDVDDLKMQNGAIYRSGFDFFVFHSSDLKAMPANQMYFGLPWWDHFLPVSILSAGARRLSSDGVDAYHLKHSGRWKRRLWRKLGNRFIRDIRGQGGAVDDTYLSAMNAAIAQGNKRRNSTLTRLLPKSFRKVDFYAISDLNVDYVDQALE